MTDRTTITVQRTTDDDVEIVINGVPTQLPIRTDKNGTYADAIGVIAPAIMAALPGVQLKGWAPPKPLKKS
ncbi:hypothetical protein [Ferrovibrio terrae]|uniref:hypothetical protein n=1 Tax=Ferrovibrio terrae TaxID=2594003 RepID=UPI0031383269